MGVTLLVHRRDDQAEARAVARRLAEVQRAAGDPGAPTNVSATVLRGALEVRLAIRAGHLSTARAQLRQLRADVERLETAIRPPPPTV